jgi:hypothetical protein
METFQIKVVDLNKVLFPVVYVYRSAIRKAVVTKQFYWIKLLYKVRDSVRPVWVKRIKL